MRVLLITDQGPESDHSAIRGIFDRELKKYAECDVVYWDRRLQDPARSNGRLLLPRRYKHRGTLRGLRALVDPAGYDVVIVRNFFGVLRSILARRDHFGYRVGFWESFPHSFRRVFEARATGRAVWRKTIEYAVKRRLESRLVARCDFYLPITETLKQRFRPTLRTPYLALPMGVDFASIDDAPLPEPVGAQKRFIYAGTVDRLRRLDLIVAAFSTVPQAFVFDLYTASDNPLVAQIRSAAAADPRIQVRPAKPRAELLRIMRTYDVGVGLIPDSPLYEVSSPTKTLEYYAAGLPVILNPLPEYASLFNASCAFQCALIEPDIQRTVREILATERATLRAMGRAGREIVKSKRDYAVLAAALHQFLEQQRLCEREIR
jgi:glycosyltransferase involved in cell wall biosynthesis